MPANSALAMALTSAFLSSMLSGCWRTISRSVTRSWYKDASPIFDSSSAFSGSESHIAGRYAGSRTDGVCRTCSANTLMVASWSCFGSAATLRARRRSDYTPA